MLTLDEKHLIECTQAGDPEAFSPLVDKYHSRLYTHITRRVTNAGVAKDLTQETWLKAFRAIHTFRGTSAFSSWLYRIAENVCIDYFRRQKHDTEPLHLIEERRVTQIHPCPSRDRVYNS
ncbi:sigma-70 family RNA polymerase sigma factor [Candidatus Poribacteria bacterium]|nr:sigma-70 family RNA polymerase sigma factor [Candidatus Poribacteria bacterium]